MVAGDYLEMISQIKPLGGDMLRVMYSDDFLVDPRPLEFRRDHLPIQHFMTEKGEVFIAITPRLREMLEFGIKREADAMVDKARDAELAAAERLSEELAKVSQFERAPLWRRLLTAWRGVL